MRHAVKITVIKCSVNNDIMDQHADSRWEPCEVFSQGQEYISSEGHNMPEGFCSWAWADILKCVLTLSRGGDFVGVKPGTFVSCCSDGFRPVFFKLERI